jgi:predicted Rossmann-fold nucleotide-binding protein
VLNIAGYYDHLIAFNAHMASVGFVRDAHKGILLVANALDDLLDKMAGYIPHKNIFAMKASDL